MKNFLEETKEALAEYDKTEEDVLWVGDFLSHMTWKDFVDYADFSYDEDYGHARINSDIMVVGSDFWFERNECNGSEWWEYKTYPFKPQKATATLKDLLRKGVSVNNKIAMFSWESDEATI